MHEMTKEAVDVYWGLRGLSMLKDETSYLLIPNKLEEGLSYTEELESLERRLIGIIQRVIQTRGLVSLQRVSIFTLFANAAILHIYVFQRDLSRGLPFFHLISRRMREVLEWPSRIAVKFKESYYLGDKL
jgi:hypothetical protein